MADREQEQQEREPQPEEVLGEILKRHEARKREQGEQPPEWFEDRIKQLPESAQQAIRAYDKRLAEKGLAVEARADLLEDRVVSFEQTYTDRRFSMDDGRYLLRETFGKEQAVSWLKRLFDEKPKVEDLNKVALLSFDANGLKAVNDLSSHERGTEYLRRIATVFAKSERASDPIGARLRELGVTEVIPLAGGGDEFSVIMRSENPLPPEALDEALRMYEQAISSLDVSDLVDFTQLDTQLRYLGITREAYEAMDEAKQAEVMAAFQKDIPEGFAMRASVSGGAATLLDGLRGALKDPRESKRLEKEEAYDEALSKIVGGVWDVADKGMVENKTWFKHFLRGEAGSEGLDDQTRRENAAYAKVLARTTEARMLESRINELTESERGLRAFTSEVGQLNELLATGVIDAAKFAQIIQEKQKTLLTKKSR
ncbi:MAG: hypothetical protein Q8P82_03225 [bacterium]|nr:hypothetical protein [bacterium]